MKNFTKQNFKTNPLWVRLIIMAFMLLAGAGTAWAATLYLKPGVWSANNPCYYAYFWGGSGNDQWERMTDSDGDGIFSCTIPGTGRTNVKILRKNPSNGCGENWDNSWNDTGDQTISGNCLTVNNWGSYSWSTITVCDPATITWETISSSMKVEGTQTISTTLTSGAGSVTYTSSDENVITVSGAMLTAVGTGTATITANHTTVTNGYCEASSIYQDITVTCDIVNTEEIQIQVECNSGKPNIYAWDTSGTLTAAWPGDAMELVDGSTNIYLWTYKPSTDKISVIFNKNSQQTTDITDLAIGLKHKFEYNGTTTATEKGFECLSPSCTPSATITEATYNCYENTIHLEGNLTEACGGMYFGWQYKTTSGDDWSAATAIAGHASNNYSTSAKTYELDWTIPSQGTTYYFRAYATPDAKTWYSDGTTKTVKTYKSPTLYTVSGSDATLTLSDSESGYTYTLYNNASPVSNSAKAGTGNALTWTLNDSGTYTVKAKPAESSCDEVLMSDSYTYDPCSPANYTVSFANSATSVSKGSTLQASVSPSGNGYGNVTWSSSATGVATVSSTGLITGKKGGQATITATVAQGTTYCGGSDTEIITVKETPSVSISGEQEFCGASTTLTASVTGLSAGITPSIAWYKDGVATSVVDDVTYNATASGTYTVKVTGTYINTTTSAGYAVTKKTAPAKPTIQANKDIVDGTISLMSGESVTFSVTQVAGETYTWYRGNNSIVRTGATYTTDVNGSYTVKAVNDCGEQISEAVTVTVCEPINGLYWEITDGKKDIYCPGDEVEVTLTYKGSEAKAHAWGGNWNGNIDILADDYATGTVYTMTINKSGSVDLTLTDCDDKTAKTSTLTFEVVEAPVKPTILFSPNPVAQNKPTTLTVGEYNGTLNNYTLYKDGDSQGAYTTPQTITIGQAGEYDYRVVATSKACPSLTATSETVTLKVQEAGAKIVQLGDLTIYTNIKTDFVPMYVQKDGIVDVDGATSVKGYTWQYSQDGNSWSNCTTNYASGVVGMSNGGVDCNNWRADKAGRYRCLITYDNDGTQYSNVLSVAAATKTAPAVNAFGDLPIISVNTGSNSFPDECSVSNNQYPSANADKMKKKVSVDVKIYDKAGKLQYDRKARMNYRGSSSLNFKKKSYAFVTGKEKTKNDKGEVDTGKANLFGLSNSCEDKDWVLYAATPDPSMMRNRLVFDLYKKMTGEWGVNSMYVELIVNNEYKGVYVLMDKITNNVNRVNITASGGFIVKFDKTDVVDRVENAEGDQKTFATTRTGTGRAEWHPNGITSYDVKIDQRFEIEYPEKEDVEDAGGNWEATYGAIQKRFEDFETALEKKDYTTVRSIIDYDSWADWFIINEYTKNMDAYRASCIFVYNGNKIEARPLWDQELSFNNVVANIKSVGANSTSGLLIQNNGVYSDAFKAPFWFTGGGTTITGGLLNDPCFVSLVKQKWATYKEGVLSTKAVSDMVDNYTTELTSNAITRENTMLNFNSTTRGQTSTCTGSKAIGYYGYGDNTGSATTHANSRDAIESWVTSRIPALTTAINGLKGEALIFTISPSTVETTPWQQVILTVNAPEGYEYTVSYDKLTEAGAIIKEGNNTYGIKIPRPGGWGTAGNGDPDDSEEYKFTANIEVSGENACGTMQDGTATSTITLKDVTEECKEEIKP